MQTAIFLPISRAQHLDRLFHSLEVLRCRREQTTLIALVDGPDVLLGQVAEYVAASKFKEPWAVQYPEQDGRPPSSDIVGRRRRIAQVWNHARQLIPSSCQYVFTVEDDTIVPADSLEKLIYQYALQPYAGFASGVELGRWGIPYVGAWSADSVYDPTKLTTLLPPDKPALTSGVQAVDAAGFYCYLTKRELFVGHDYRPFAAGQLGPDVEFGLAMRQEGRQCFVDWSVRCEHRVAMGEPLTLANTRPLAVHFWRDVSGPGEWTMGVEG